MASLVEGRQSAQNYSDSDDENKKKLDKGKQRATETYEETDKKPDKGKGKATDNQESSRSHGASTQGLLHPDAARARARPKPANRARPSTATQQHQPCSEPSGSRVFRVHQHDYTPFSEMEFS
ncbi:hypothetical protein NW762_009391 [Fusarium torreyae]|uniref:Uncharacterized protein n=1 Tax=Fusarium torreyae TaxID=1237075 RepID=A0A9W8RUR2_9HYPO|nr:hypothetical protein NW762_009391 [Fusarium torreyae]